MAKYIIDVPDSFVDITNGLHIPMDKQGSFRIDTGLKLTPYTEPDEDESYGVNRYKAIGLAFLKWLGNDVGDKLKSADDVYQFLDKNCYNKDAVEDEVWDFARRIICPSDCCEDSISKYTEKFLGIPSHKARAIFKDLSYQEVKAKYKKWRKQKDEIRVGDEVELELSEGVKGLVYIVGEEMLEGAYLNCDGLVPFCWSKKDCRKTGKHFDEIEELLKKMKEE